VEVSSTDHAAPADSGPNTSGATLVSQAAQGSLEIVRVVAERTVECPNVKFVIFGTSALHSSKYSYILSDLGCKAELGAGFYMDMQQC
jgi:hypothetical protein